jgi:hypothetical protein
MAEGKPNVTVIQHDDFLSYSPELLERLKGAEGCVWAQGISVTQVDKKEYEKITVDFPLAAAKAFATLSNRFKFVYVSGEGVSTSAYVMFWWTSKLTESRHRHHLAWPPPTSAKSKAKPSLISSVSPKQHLHSKSTAFGRAW